MIDMALARVHLKADNEDIENDLIAQYIASAKTICEGYCNRKFYETTEARTADRITALVDLELARDVRDAELDLTEDCEERSLATSTYIQALGNVRARINGVVVDDAIRAAMLMTLGHLYKNRQDVVAGQYSGATQMPVGAQRILQPYLWIGDLG